MNKLKAQADACASWGDINLNKAFYQDQNKQARYQMEFKAKALGFGEAYSQMETVFSLTGAAIKHEDIATVYGWLGTRLLF